MGIHVPIGGYTVFRDQCKGRGSRVVGIHVPIGGYTLYSGTSVRGGDLE